MEKARGIARYYDIELGTDDTGQRATAVRFTRKTQPGSLMTHPGVYCLRSNQTDWDEETLWRTYFMLTDCEAVFRALKSELGLHPICHHKPACRRTAAASLPPSAAPTVAPCACAKRLSPSRCLSRLFSMCWVLIR